MENFQKNVDKMKADEAETDAPVSGQACSREAVLRAEMVEVHHLPGVPETSEDKKVQRNFANLLQELDKQRASCPLGSPPCTLALHWWGGPMASHDSETSATGI